MGTFGFTTCAGKTKLSGEKSTYSARVKHFETVCDRALAEGIAAEIGYTPMVVSSVLMGMRKFLCEQLKEGNKVDFGAFSVGLSVRGAFPAANSPFNPSVNRIGVDIRAGKELRDAVANLVPQNITNMYIPHIGSVLSLAHPDGSNYSKIMRGDECQMAGTDFATDYTGDGDGVWLENRKGERVATARIGEHSLVAVNFTFDEEIPLGEYWLVIGCRDPEHSMVATGKRLVTVVSTLA